MTFIDAYEAQAATMFYPRRNGHEDYMALMAKKEAALAGWIAYVALQNPRSSALSPQYLHLMFGEWANRALRIERRGDSWFLIG